MGRRSWHTVGHDLADRRGFVASPRFAALLEDFTGWRPYPVEVFDKRGDLVPGCVGVAITGRCGLIRCDVSRTTGPGPARSYIGLLFDTATWDGSDLFVPPNKGFILMTGRLAAAVRKARIGNVLIQPISEFRVRAAFVREDGYPNQDVWE